MKRTQLYLDDELWSALHAKAKLDKTSISELVRAAARDRYLVDADKRQDALMGIVGIWKDRTDLPDTETYVRKLREGSRLKRLGIL